MKQSLAARLNDKSAFSFALGIIFIGLLFHLWLARFFPLTNDEAYYWDWGQALELSYFDHPPGVAWLTALSAQLGTGLWEARLLMPFMHALASVFLLLCLREIARGLAPLNFLILAAATVLIPGFGLLGVFALPDAGLYPAITAALWLCLRWQKRAHLGIFQGLILGVVLGLAGLSKYHALPIGGGMLLALLYGRRRQWQNELGFWLMVLASGLTMTLPVWLWNMANDWASIRFQTEHGMGGLRFSLSGGLRTLAGAMIFVTPWFFLMLLQTIRRLRSSPEQLESDSARLILAASLPLILLLATIGFFKLVLLHWIMPGFWLLLPALAALSAREWAASRKSWLLAAGLSVLLPSVLAQDRLRGWIEDQLGPNAAPLRELTIWSQIDAALQKEKVAQQPEQRAGCPAGGFVAGQRWYVVAQLHFLARDQRPLISLDREHPSYYTFRDQNLDWVDCAVTLVVAEENFRPERFADIMSIEQLEFLDLPRPAGTRYLMAKGRLLSGPKQVLRLDTSGH